MYRCMLDILVQILSHVRVSTGSGVSDESLIIDTAALACAAKAKLCSICKGSAPLPVLEGQFKIQNARFGQ